MGAVKNLYRGSFNLNREVFVEYAYAYTERQAWAVFCRRIAKKTGVSPRVAMNQFNGEKDNYNITTEVEIREVTE